jgi:hypothetical protein
VRSSLDGSWCVGMVTFVIRGIQEGDDIRFAGVGGEWPGVVVEEMISYL